MQLIPRSHSGLFAALGAPACALALVLAATHDARAEGSDASPFRVTPSVKPTGKTFALVLTFEVPKDHHLYADELSCELDGTPVALTLPAPATVADKFNGGSKRVYIGEFQGTCPLLGTRPGPLSLVVNLHGCNHEECFFPESRRWAIQPDHSIQSLDAAVPAPAEAGPGPLARDFKVAARASGFLGTERFIGFLRGATAGAEASDDAFAGFGFLATLGLILLGGLALNLTPCVLPMIPINLAILGVGANRQDRTRGFSLGATYGAGMAAAYGGLGLAVVLTGSRFGSLNSSVWFNIAIALVFVVLGLAMFDLIHIDLSRFQPAGGASDPKARAGGAFAAAGSMGALSALLAGACVAPVVISVLLLATDLYQQGKLYGLLLPFVLGLGMALPWPFAAAGLSFLPKPGPWMVQIKQGFGVAIFLFAAWYGWTGWNLASSLQVQARAGQGHSSQARQQLRNALAQAQKSRRPVLIDFWASWCKNCAAMEHTTLRDSRVQQELKDYLVVRIQAEHLADAQLKPVLDEFGVMGLPTFVVLTPASVPPVASKLRSAP